MYGQQIGLPATGVGGAAALAGISIGSAALALFAVAMMVGGLALMFINHRRRKGLRP